MKNARLKLSHRKTRGFTLIEMVVALAIFIIVVTVTVTIFASILKAQRKTYNLQITQDTARYLIEMMAKEIRMSTIKSIVVLAGNPVDGSQLKIERLDDPGEEIRYSFNNDHGGDANCLGRDKGVDERILNDPAQVYVRGYFYGDSKRITIVMQAKSVNTRPGEEVVIKLQTSVASRDY